MSETNEQGAQDTGEREETNYHRDMQQGKADRHETDTICLWEFKMNAEKWYKYWIL